MGVTICASLPVALYSMGSSMKRSVAPTLLLLTISLAIFATQIPRNLSPRWLATAAGALARPFTTRAAQGNVQRPAKKQRTLDNFDIRANVPRTLAEPPTELREVKSRQLRALGLNANAAEQSLAAEPQGRFRWSALTGTPSRFLNLESSPAGNQLEQANNTDAAESARSFLRRRRELFRLRDDEVSSLNVARRFRTDHNGLTHVTLEQRVGGIGVFQGRMNLHVDRAGTVVAAAGEVVPDAANNVNLARPQLSSGAALKLAAEFADVELQSSASASAPRAETNSPEQAQTFDQSVGFARDVDARLVYFPLNATSLRLAWEFTLWLNDSPDVYLVVVDAERGSLLYRFNYTTYDENPLRPHGPVYPGESPRPASPFTGNTNPATAARVDTPFHAAPFNGTMIFGVGDKHYDWWAGQSATGLVGNNVDAHLDRTPADNFADAPRLTAADGNFTFPIDLTLEPTTADNAKAAQVNLFYWVNRYHDILYSFGFTESAGNFQADNFGLGGAAGDAIQADVQDGGGTNNANFATPPDGSAGRVQMYLWSGSPQFDGALDQGVVIHELTHGLSNRLIGNGTGLVGMQAQGMGEGWSDFFGLALLRGEGDDVDGSYPVGQYVRNDYAKGIRRYPYSTSLAVNPLTFAQIAANTEVHRVGEIWCGMLWEVRAGLVKKYGFREGQRQSLQLVVDGMKLTPNAPSFTDARDAILLADRVNNGGANQCLLWQAFAKRGLGYGAKSQGADDPAPTESFDVPPFCNDTGSVRLDKTSYLIGEAVRVSVGDHNAANPVRVQLSSTATGDQETLTLTPDLVYIGAYNGTLRTGAGRATANDGTLQASVEAGDQIKVTYLDASAGGGATAQSAATAAVVREKVIFEDNAERGNQGWIKTGNWAITTSRAVSPTHAWTDSPDGNYANNSGANGPSLTSPLFDCTGLSDITLSFSHGYAFENGFDRGYVEFSTDDGATWTPAASYTGTSTAFKQTIVGLDALAGQAQARVRFRVYSDMSVSADGWYIDDIRLTGRSASGTVINPGTTNAPVITSITPAYGPVAGNTSVQIIGQNFTETADTAVTFDGIAARSIHVVSSSVMNVTTPPLAAGQARPVTVRVANHYGEVALAEGFTYYAAGAPAKMPALGNVFPNAGSTRGGATVTLSGADFTPETVVRFGPFQAVTAYVNPRTLRVLAPVNGTTGPVEVSVSNGTLAATLRNAFTYHDPTPPTVAVLSPQGGETLFINQTVTIRWNSSDNSVLGRHRVQLYRNVGGSLAPVMDLADLPGEAQSVNWTIPATVQPMTNARIRVLAIDEEGTETETFSSNDFTIARRWEAQASLTPALQRLAVVSDGTSLFAVGGRTAATDATAVDTLSRFNAVGNVWTSDGLVKLPNAASGVAAAYLNGKIYVAGGIVNGVVSAQFYAYDIMANAWTKLADMPAPLTQSVLTADPARGVLYLTGGTAGNSTAAARVYNPHTNAWSDLRPMRAPRAMHLAAVMDGKLYVAGGFGFTGSLATCDVYDVATEQWSAAANLTRGRFNAAGAVVTDAAGNPYWLLVGGQGQDPNDVLATAEVYDVRHNRWLALDHSFTLAAPRTQFGGAVVNGYFYAVGGTMTGSGFTSSASVERLRVVPFTPGDGNLQPPALGVPAAPVAVAGNELSFEVIANDLNASRPVTLTAAGLPGGAGFTPANAGNNSARGVFKWTPASGDTGHAFTVNFTADNGQNSDTRAVTIRVVTASPLAVVNAANYKQGALPPESIATAFGTDLAVGIDFARELPLPTSLAGTTLTVNGVAAQLLYVSPTQINFIVPANLTPGPATIIVSNPAGSYALGTSQITDTAPGIFSADASGAGNAAALATSDGVSIQSAPFDVNVNGRQNVLLLFGTGLRHAAAANSADENGVAEAVQVTIEGQPAQVLYAGAQPQFAGLDQLNVVLPANLKPGARDVDVVISVNGAQANRVTIKLR